MQGFHRRGLDRDGSPRRFAPRTFSATYKEKRFLGRLAWVFRLDDLDHNGFSRGLHAICRHDETRNDEMELNQSERHENPLIRYAATR